jgi:hypothetical protein
MIVERLRRHAMATPAEGGVDGLRHALVRLAQHADLLRGLDGAQLSQQGRGVHQAGMRQPPLDGDEGIGRKEGHLDADGGVLQAQRIDCLHRETGGAQAPPGAQGDPGDPKGAVGEFALFLAAPHVEGVRKPPARQPDYG